MKYRFAALLVFTALALNLAPIALAESVAETASAPAVSSLVSMLPASDVVVSMDTKRVLTDAMPTLFASNPTMLGKVAAKLDEMTRKTGIDLRKFESAALGAAVSSTPAKQVDVDLVAIARGDINTDALVAMARLASNGAYREVKIGEHTAYVFSMKDAVAKAKQKTPAAKTPGPVDKAFEKLASEVAVASVDRSTLVLGSLAKVTQTLERRTSLSPDLAALMNERSSSILSFAMQTPAGISSIIPVDMDEVGKMLTSVKLAAGSMDMSAAGGTLNVMARTHRPEQAKGLSDMLLGLQMFGGNILSSSKKPDQQTYGRMLQGARIAHTGSDVSLTVSLAPADISFLGSKIK